MFFFIPMLVVLEVIWVLESVYSIERQEILDSFEALLSLSLLELESHPTVRRFIGVAQKSKIDLPDPKDHFHFLGNIPDIS